MITEAIINVLAGILSWVLGLMPTIALPPYVTGTGAGTANGALTTAMTALWSVDAIVPVAQLIAAAALVLLALGVAVGVRVLRIIASFLSAGGGSAA